MAHEYLQSIRKTDNESVQGEGDSFSDSALFNIFVSLIHIYPKTYL